jgi:hypothetical protein
MPAGSQAWVPGLWLRRQIKESLKKFHTNIRWRSRNSLNE